MKIKLIIHNVALLALALLIAGCEEEEQYELRFSHYLHVTENEMGCDECHGELGQPSFNAITHDTCLDCHEEPEAEEISVDTCGICHQEKQLKAFSLAEPDEAKSTETAVAEVAPSRTIFVHTEALAGKCTDCHDSLLNEELETVPMLNRDDVVVIRETAHGSGQDCLTCHVDMERDQEPPSHDVAWLKRHGQFGMQDVATCTVCHSEDSCTECHSVMQPVSHNNLFRSRTHGVLAAWDRATCQVCHEEDSCVSCHSQTPPRSHRGQWAASGKYPSHCISCHTGATPGEGCVACHEEGNNVLLHETFWPDSHDLLGDTANCYQCHMFGKF